MCTQITVKVCRRLRSDGVAAVEEGGNHHIKEKNTEANEGDSDSKCIKC